MGGNWGPDEQSNRSTTLFFDKSDLGLKLKADSWQIVAPYFAMRVWDASNGRGTPQYIGTPWACNHNADQPELAGHSDHFPVIVTLE